MHRDILLWILLVIVSSSTTAVYVHGVQLEKELSTMIDYYDVESNIEKISETADKVNKLLDKSYAATDKMQASMDKLEKIEYRLEEASDKVDNVRKSAETTVNKTKDNVEGLLNTYNKVKSFTKKN